MADATDLEQLKNRDSFLAHYHAGTLPKLDFSGEAVCFDFSGLTLGNVNFSNCVLSGSSFRNAALQQCDFSGADWRGCDFDGAYFNGGAQNRIKNAHRALNLTNAKADCD
jgi:uncharacterized protein YjbI with pentapeptide repeats